MNKLFFFTKRSKILQSFVNPSKTHFLTNSNTNFSNIRNSILFSSHWNYSTQNDEKKEIAQTNQTYLKDFVLKTYKYTGTGIVSSLTTAHLMSWYLQHSDLSYPLVFGVGMLTSIGAVLPISYYYYNTLNIENKDNKYVIQKNVLFGTLCLGVGLTISPLMWIVEMIFPRILPLSIVLTASYFAGSSLYVKTTNDIEAIPAALYGTVLGLISIGLMSSMSGFIFGYDCVTAKLFTKIDTYVLLGMFSIFTGFDTHIAVKNFKDKSSDYMDCAMELFINFVSIFGGIGGSSK